MAEFNEETITIDDGENEYDLSLEHDWDESEQLEPEYSVEVSYTGGASLESVDVVETTLAATGLTVTANTERELDLSWSKQDDTTDGEWRIFRDGTQIDTIADVTITSYTDTGLTDGTSYTYYVQRYISGETYDSSEESETTILPAATVTTTVQSFEEIDIDWTKEDNNTTGSWEIFRSADGSLGSSIYSSSDLSTTSYSDTGLDTNTTYYYTVRRITNDTSSDSTQSSATTELRIDAEITSSQSSALTSSDIDLIDVFDEAEITRYLEDDWDKFEWDNSRWTPNTGDGPKASPLTSEDGIVIEASGVYTPSSASATLSSEHITIEEEPIITPSIGSPTASASTSSASDGGVISLSEGTPTPSVEAAIADDISSITTSLSDSSSGVSTSTTLPTPIISESISTPHDSDEFSMAGDESMLSVSTGGAVVSSEAASAFENMKILAESTGVTLTPLGPEDTAIAISPSDISASNSYILPSDSHSTAIDESGNTNSTTLSFGSDEHALSFEDEPIHTYSFTISREAEIIYFVVAATTTALSSIASTSEQTSFTEDDSTLSDATARPLPTNLLLNIVDDVRKTALTATTIEGNQVTNSTTAADRVISISDSIGGESNGIAETDPEIVEAVVTTFVDAAATASTIDSPFITIAAALTDTGETTAQSFDSPLATPTTAQVAEPTTASRTTDSAVRVLSIASPYHSDELSIAGDSPTISVSQAHAQTSSSTSTSLESARILAQATAVTPTVIRSEVDTTTYENAVVTNRLSALLVSDESAEAIEVAERSLALAEELISLEDTLSLSNAIATQSFATAATPTTLSGATDGATTASAFTETLLSVEAVSAFDVAVKSATLSNALQSAIDTDATDRAVSSIALANATSADEISSTIDSALRSGSVAVPQELLDEYTESLTQGSLSFADATTPSSFEHASAIAVGTRSEALSTVLDGVSNRVVRPTVAFTGANTLTLGSVSSSTAEPSSIHTLAQTLSLIIEADDVRFLRRLAEYTDTSIVDNQATGDIENLVRIDSAENGVIVENEDYMSAEVEAQTNDAIIENDDGITASESSGENRVVVASGELTNASVQSSGNRVSIDGDDTNVDEDDRGNDVTVDQNGENI